MALLKITNINDYVYTMIDLNNKSYKLIIEFVGNKTPKVEDVMQIDERLIDYNNIEFCQPYRFELSTQSPKQVFNNKDFVIIKQDNKFLVYERKYG